MCVCGEGERGKKRRRKKKKECGEYPRPCVLLYMWKSFSRTHIVERMLDYWPCILLNLLNINKVITNEVDLVDPSARHGWHFVSPHSVRTQSYQIRTFFNSGSVSNGGSIISHGSIINSAISLYKFAILWLLMKLSIFYSIYGRLSFPLLSIAHSYTVPIFICWVTEALSYVMQILLWGCGVSFNFNASILYKSLKIWCSLAD